MTTPTTSSPAGHGQDIPEEDWTDRKDAALLARCSDDTIKRTEEAHGLQTRKGDRGQTQVRLSDLIRVGRISQADFPTGGTGTDAAEVRRAQHRIEELLSELGTVRGQLAERDSTLEMQRQHLESLRQQLSDRDRAGRDQARHITDLISALQATTRGNAQLGQVA